jgi:2,5-furandicarboxylate decarboxylase 1
VREVIDTDPDLEELPLVLHSEKDVGHYITAGTEVVTLPHTDVRGLGIHRMYRRDSSELTLWAPEERRIGYAYRHNAGRGKPTEIAIAIGVSPAVTIGSISNVPHAVDKFDVAGGLAGKPIELVPCETVDIEVPASAEIVVEGIIHGNESVSEAPFGEVAGCYSTRQTDVPPVKVTGIMRRDDAMYHTILTGFPPTENSIMQWIPRSSTVKQDAERAVPEVDQATVKCGEYGGNGVYEAFVSIDKRLDGEAWNVINSVLSGRSQAKYCTVVDTDIDLYDEKQINWAINTRVQPDDNIRTYPTMAGAPLDPSGEHRQSQKVGIDATIPLDEDSEPYERVTVPGVDEVEW